MTKIRRFDNFQHRFSFISPADQFDLYFHRFLESDLGKIYSAIPWNSLVNTFGLDDSKKGPVSMFSPQGKLALMFLKHYACCSDKRLVEQLNGNMEYQFFCGIALGSERITNEKLLWESVEWSYRQLKSICKALRIKPPRTKYLKWKRRNISYSKMRRKTKSKRRSLTRSLLLLLNKINAELRKLEKAYNLQMPKRYYQR
jgi:hypothetical protein